MADNQEEKKAEEKKDREFLCPGDEMGYPSCFECPLFIDNDCEHCCH